MASLKELSHLGGTSQGLTGIGKGWSDSALTALLISLEFEQFEEKVEAVFVTKWQDLGQGRSPMDYKWQSHVARSAERLWLSVKLNRGSVYAMFERKERLRFESTSLWTQQDRKELLGLLEHT